MPSAIAHAKKLRRSQTDAERLLWNTIRAGKLGAHFRRQVPIGPYFADFACLEVKLVIEADGSQHAGSASDEARTAFMNELGFDVMRFWNNEVLSNIEGVAAAITERISQRRDRG